MPPPPSCRALPAKSLPKLLQLVVTGQIILGKMSLYHFLESNVRYFTVTNLLCH